MKKDLTPEDIAKLTKEAKARLDDEGFAWLEEMAYDDKDPVRQKQLNDKTSPPPSQPGSPAEKRGVSLYLLNRGGGAGFLVSPEGERWLKSRDGADWLKTAPGIAWLKTPDGKKFVLPMPNAGEDAKNKAKGARESWLEIAKDLDKKFHPREGAEADSIWKEAETTLAQGKQEQAAAIYLAAGERFAKASENGLRTRKLQLDARRALDQLTPKRRKWLEIAGKHPDSLLPPAAKNAEREFKSASDSAEALPTLANVPKHASLSQTHYDAAIKAITDEMNQARDKAGPARQRALSLLSASQKNVRAEFDATLLKKKWDDLGSDPIAAANRLAANDPIGARLKFDECRTLADKVEFWLTNAPAPVEGISNIQEEIDTQLKRLGVAPDLYAWPSSALKEAKDRLAQDDPRPAMTDVRQAKERLGRVDKALQGRPWLALPGSKDIKPVAAFAGVASKRAEADGKLQGGDWNAAEKLYEEAHKLYPLLTAPCEKSVVVARQRDWAAALETKEFPYRSDIEFAIVPPGEFSMGASAAEIDELQRAQPGLKREHFQPEQPQRLVRISRPFRLARYETSQDDYQRVMKRNPSWFSAQGGGKQKVGGRDTSRLPVENVSWFDAAEYCNALSILEGLPEFYALARASDGTINSARVIDADGKGYRLPTEAEWEYACRAGTASAFHFGDEFDAAKANVDGSSPSGTAAGRSLGQTAEVGSFRLANALGLFDMHGNVCEWCHDGYDEGFLESLPPNLAIDPTGGLSFKERAVRGGSYFNYAYKARSASRRGHAPGFRDLNLGFRPARFE